MSTLPQRLIGRLLITIFFLNCFASLSPASIAARALDRKRKPVVVSFGQPNIWTLEQAHYLLARMHMTNLDLQAKVLTESDLDPNAINGTRIQILKQLLEIGASFDQGVGFQNQRLAETARFNDNRRRELTTSRDTLRARSMQLSLDLNDLRRQRAGVADATSDKAKELNAAIKQKEDDQTAVEKQITFQDNELQKLGAEPSGTPAAATVPTPSASPRLPSSVLDKLSDEEVKKLLTRDRDSKLNATTMLDNTVQLQYEIIAKQLTLLRDEVGPGERLVFLELPQSVYTTPGDGDEKMAQAWWHVNGYSRTDPLLRALLELFEVEQRWNKIKGIPAYSKRQQLIDAVPCDEPEGDESDAASADSDAAGNKPLTDAEQAEKEKKKQEAAAKRKKLEADTEAFKVKRKAIEKDTIAEVFYGLKCERENAREAVLSKLYREGNNLFARVEQNGARDTNEMVEAIRKLIAVNTATPSDDKKSERTNDVVDVRGEPGQEKPSPESESQRRESARRAWLEDMKNDLLIVLSEDDPMRPSSDGQKALNRLNAIFNINKDGKPEVDGKEFEKGLEFIRLDEDFVREKGSTTDIERRAVRTVDIIPRQSSLNVNDVQETVKATGILAAFKFLFGFAGQANFQRQREQFEQFLHQELYASGFGKGDRDFGWTFGALPGTKRVAPGVRTTYAALVVPDDAESIVLSARGCYFPRKSYQPLDFSDTGHADWADDDKFRRYNCGDEQTYILTIPGGGDISNFWVTNVDYEGGQKGGDFVTVSVRGNNFSSQMGVLVDGVPLTTTVGLAQPHLMPKKAVAAGGAQPVASDCSSATSAICGRYERIDPEQIVFSFRMPTNYVGTPTITLIAPGKSVDLNSIPRLRINGKSNVNLRDRAAFMFGTRPGLSITDMQLLSDPLGSTRVTALLTGTGFDARDSVYVNGRPLVTPQEKNLRSPNLYELGFYLPADDNLKVTVVRDGEVATKTVANPAALKINSTSVLSYTPPDKKKKRPGVMLAKIVGTGFTSRLQPYVEGAARQRVVGLSPTEIIIRLVDPEPPVVIKLTDVQTGGSVSTVIQSLPAQQETPPPKQQ